MEPKINNMYAVRDKASGLFLSGNYLSKTGDIKLYRNPGPAKGLVTKLRKSQYFCSGEAGYYAQDLEVVAMAIVPTYVISTT